MKPICSLVILFSLVILSAINAPVMAHDGEEHGDSAHHESTPVAAAHSADEVFATIDSLQHKLTDAVSAKSLDQVHELAFSIRDTAKQLPTFSSEQRRSRIEGLVANIATLAARLDKSGDAGDQQTTEENLEKMETLLKLLRAQFLKS